MNSKLYGSSSMLVVMLVVATLAIVLMATDSATADKLLTNRRICKDEANLETCKTCCANAGYTRDETEFEDEECCCYLKNQAEKLRKSDNLYEVSADGYRMTLIKGAENDSVLGSLRIL